VAGVQVAELDQPQPVVPRIDRFLKISREIRERTAGAPDSTVATTPK